MRTDLFYITPQDEKALKAFSDSFALKKILNGWNIPNGGANVLKKIYDISESEFLLVQLTDEDVFLFENSLARFETFAENLSADFLYSDFLAEGENGTEPRSLIDYQPGSVRDDFDFGKFVFIRREILGKYLEQAPASLEYSAFYDFRLFVSRAAQIFRVPEALYVVPRTAKRKTGEAIFDYVKKEFRKIQAEREKVFTNYLKEIGAFLPPITQKVEYEIEKFPVTASVIIPVKNRVKTIADAINSALNQKTQFEFNIIVVDNHSSDGTTDVVKEISRGNDKVIHIIPEEKHLGIGGCWNLAVNDKRCGAFAVQLDSDDVYSPDGKTLQKIVDKFLQTGASAVVGSYVVTDFELNELPPGKVLHEEWTNENGHNNALRINGFGAPRAFYAPVIREIGFPDVSYGEDYAVMLEITRRYFLARIFEPIYFARRWQGNSDADLTWEKQNKFNGYKDFIRTAEINARLKLNGS